jgi:aldehyde dehydrogenase (NAD+)
MSTFTSPEEFEEAYATLFRTFGTGKTKSLAWRKWQLKQCRRMVVENEDRIAEALKADLNKPEFEARGMEIILVKRDILDQIEHFEEWAADDIPHAFPFPIFSHRRSERRSSYQLNSRGKHRFWRGDSQ